MEGRLERLDVLVPTHCGEAAHIALVAAVGIEIQRAAPDFDAGPVGVGEGGNELRDSVDRDSSEV